MLEKINIIGLDGCELDFILKLVGEGKLPFFKEVLESGTHGKMRSTIPPTTFPAWPSMFTGKNPGKLGAFDFFQISKENGRYVQKLINSRIWRGSLVWDIAGMYNKTSGIINIPFFMPTKIDGYWLDLHMGVSYPAYFHDKIYSDIDVARGFDKKIKSIKINELKRLKKNTEIEFEIGDYLDKKYVDTDVFIQVFNILDGTAHSTLSEKILEDRYIFIDNELKEYYDENNINTLIVSDHGMKKVNYRYYVNKWLLENKYLDLKENVKIRNNKLSRWIAYKLTNIFPSLEFHLNDIANILGKKISPMKNVRNKEGKDNEGYATNLIDWNSTNIYAHASNASNYMGLWFIEYNKQIKEELVNKLNEIKYGKNNDCVIKNIFDRDMVYKGNELSNLPQLILELQGDVLAHTAFAPMECRSTRTFAHDLYGTLVAWGPDIREGYEIQGAEIIDVTPTVLEMMGVPIPEDVDGRVLEEIIKK